jgi:hypothetical protein
MSNNQGTEKQEFFKQNRETIKDFEKLMDDMEKGLLPKEGYQRSFAEELLSNWKYQSFIPKCCYPTLLDKFPALKKIAPVQEAIMDLMYTIKTFKKYEDTTEYYISVLNFLLESDRVFCEAVSSVPVEEITLQAFIKEVQDSNQCSALFIDTQEGWNKAINDSNFMEVFEPVANSNLVMSGFLGRIPVLKNQSPLIIPNATDSLETYQLDIFTDAFRHPSQKCLTNGCSVHIHPAFTFDFKTTHEGTFESIKFEVKNPSLEFVRRLKFI